MTNHTIEKNNNLGRRSKKNAKNRQYIAFLGIVLSLILVIGVVAVYSAFNIYKPSIKTNDTEISTSSSANSSSTSDNTLSEAYDEEWEKNHHAHSPAESYYARPNVKIADDETVYSNASKKYTFTENDIDILVLAVQHEVGINPDYYPNCKDFDKLQQMMARVIINRVGQAGFGNTLKEVLEQPNQFTGLLDDVSHFWELPNSNQYDLNDKRTRANVEAAINGTDGLPGYIYFERCSLPGQSNIVEAWEYARSMFLSPTIQLYWYEETKDGRFIMFISNTNGAY